MVLIWGWEFQQIDSSDLVKQGCLGRSVSCTTILAEQVPATRQLEPPVASQLLFHNYNIWISEALIYSEWSLSIRFGLRLKLPSHSPVLAANMVIVSCQIGSNRPLRYVTRSAFYSYMDIYPQKYFYLPVACQQTSFPWKLSHWTLPVSIETALPSTHQLVHFTMLKKFSIKDQELNLVKCSSCLIHQPTWLRACWPKNRTFPHNELWVLKVRWFCNCFALGCLASPPLKVDF